MFDILFAGHCQGKPGNIPYLCASIDQTTENQLIPKSKAYKLWDGNSRIEKRNNRQ